MTKACPICGSSEISILAAYRSKHPTFAGLKLTNCHSCGMVFANPMPGEVALEKYNASFLKSTQNSHPRSVGNDAFFSGIARVRQMHLERYLSLHNIDVSSLLEIGAGPGFFALNYLVDHPNTNYFATETESSYHSSLEKIGVHIIEPDAVGRSTELVDLVFMSHVLEHISTPAKFLKDVTQNLRKGGALFIEVPCRDYEYKPIEEPHILFFDKRSMEYLLSENGFEQIQVSYHGQEIKKMNSRSFLKKKLLEVRSKLISFGLVKPFANHKDMESIKDPLERAFIAPFKAHCESLQPAWWLRAIATKR
ncbi:MAG: methyltransferase domain-containing protein [Bacteroidia bacterium]|nr:methyltransferase domain-containing protein [Bacteroidia bacterium]